MQYLQTFLEKQCHFYLQKIQQNECVHLFFPLKKVLKIAALKPASKAHISRRNISRF